jgi:hypothetical protein
MEFLGHKPEYWLELQKKADELNVGDLIKEIARLRGKISLYESRIAEMNFIKNDN